MINRELMSMANLCLTCRSTSNVPLEEEGNDDHEEDISDGEDAVDGGVDDDDDTAVDENPTTSAPLQAPRRPALPATSAASPSRPVPATKRKKAVDKIDQEMLSALSKAQQAQSAILNEITKSGATDMTDDAETKFAESTIMTLRRFSPYKRALAKAKIQQILLEVEFGEPPEVQPLQTSKYVGNALGALYP